jgi:putative FmdB family regulatory protein
MPIYEYACTNCEHAFDELQKVSEAALVHCPKCGEPSLRKRLSAPKFRLKGQGWYETDFKTGDKRNLHGESEKDGKTKEAAPKKTDDKPSSDVPAKSAEKPKPDAKVSTT